MVFKNDIDLTIIMNVLLADGIGRQGIGLVNTIHDSLKVNAYQLPPCNYKDISKNVMKVLAKPFDGFGKVAFWTFILGLNEGLIPIHKSITSELKIAYSMFESDAIPELWVNILNSYYDLVVVPDEWLISVYKNSGVNIPIFVVPLGIIIEEFLAQPIKEKVNDIFTFGMSAGLWERKNHIKLLHAFKNQFGNDAKFKLKLHGRFGSYSNQIQQAVKEANCSNVELITKPLSQLEYLNLMKSFDCYVFPSQGEGFSVTPREALALGIPCIVSNNSAQQTICKSGHVKVLESTIKKSAKYEVFGNKVIGNYYDCDTLVLQSHMLHVVNNYDLYLKNSLPGKEWVKQYLWSELKPIYLNLFKPKSIVFSSINKVDGNIFQTNNKKLFNKMKDLFK